MHDYKNSVFYLDDGKTVKLSIVENRILNRLLINKSKVVLNYQLNTNHETLKEKINSLRRKTKIKIYAVGRIGYVIL